MIPSCISGCGQLRGFSGEHRYDRGPVLGHGRRPEPQIWMSRVLALDRVLGSRARRLVGDMDPAWRAVHAAAPGATAPFPAWLTTLPPRLVTTAGGVGTWQRQGRGFLSCLRRSEQRGAGRVSAPSARARGPLLRLSCNRGSATFELLAVAHAERKSTGEILGSAVDCLDSNLSGMQ